MSLDTLQDERSESGFNYEKYKNDFFAIYYVLWDVERFYEQNIQNVGAGAVLKNAVYDKLKEANVLDRCQTLAQVLPSVKQRKIFNTFGSLFRDILVFLTTVEADSVENIEKIRKTLERIRKPLGRFMKRRGLIKDAD